MDNVFQACAEIHLNEERRKHADDLGKQNDADLVTLSSLIANSARPSPAILKDLSRHHASGSLFKNCCLRAVTTAANPLIPGVTLLVRLEAAAKQTTEGERRALVNIQSSVHELLLEIFERLPQTVGGLDEAGGVNACKNLFEPELKREEDEWNGLADPLQMIVSSHQQLQAFCKVPLVMDYLSSRFALGLPDLNDTEGLLRNKKQLKYLADGKTNGQDNGLVLGDGGEALSSLPWFEHKSEETDDAVCALRQPGACLQAAKASCPNLVYFPGAQFIVAGVVGAPGNYYRVPAMRMALDFVVYLGMVHLLSYAVLFHSATERNGGNPSDEDDPEYAFTWGEGACALTFISVRTS